MYLCKHHWVFHRAILDSSCGQTDIVEMLARLIGVQVILLCMQEKIVFADDMLVANAITKIEDGDVILTYASSSVVFDILVKAHQV